MELVPAWPPIACYSQHDSAQALGGAIDKGGQPGRPGADDRQVIDLWRGPSLDSVGGGNVGEARIVLH